MASIQVFTLLLSLWQLTGSQEVWVLSKNRAADLYLMCKHRRRTYSCPEDTVPSACVAMLGKNLNFLH